jgi:imidazolonepropionase-like amidohydrolase
MQFHKSYILTMAMTGMLSACSEPDMSQEIVSSVPYKADSGDLLVKCGTIIDGQSDKAQKGISVLIQDGKILSVAADVKAPRSTAVIDLSDYTCMPGFIDMHTHIMEDDYTPALDYYIHTVEHTMAKGREFTHATLMAGFTSVRNLGVYYGGTSILMRDEINRGDAIGPRMQVASIYLTIPGGGGDIVIPGVPEDSIPSHLRQGVARGPDEFRVKAQAAVDSGAGVLKIIASGAVLAYGGVPGAPEMTPEEISAVVDVARGAGIPVAAHAHGAQSVKNAIVAGVDSIEHASMVDDEGIRLALEHDVAFSMDIYNGDWIAVVYRKQNMPEEFLRKNDETMLAQRQNFKKAHDAGVPIVFGTDSGVYPHGMNAIQFRHMVKWGMTEMEAIKSATSVAAQVMQWGDRLGTIQKGLYGDIVAVKGDPLSDIRELENIDVVIKGGLIFKAP